MLEVGATLKVRKRANFIRLPQKANSLTDVDLLRYYAEQWYRYTTGANYCNRLLVYLNRYWVKRERDEGKKNIFQVYTVRAASWCYRTADLTRPSISLLCRNGRSISLCKFRRTTPPLLTPLSVS